MARLSFAILLTLAVYATAQLNYRCPNRHDMISSPPSGRTPNSWMGDAFFIDYDTRREGFSEIVYNAIDETIYEREYRRSEGSRPTESEQWYNFRTQTKYNRTFGGECRSYTISRPLSPFGIPSDSRFEGKSTFGVTLYVDSFSGTFGDEYAGNYYLFWAPASSTSDFECVPVVETFVREGTTTPFSERRNIHITYTNITTSFENPPAPCIP